MKVYLSGAVPAGIFYQKLKTFNPQEIHKNVGINIFCGIYPSPQVYTKVNPQHAGKVYGNEFVYNSFSTDANHFHKNFKELFVFQKPRLNLHLKQNV